MSNLIFHAEDNVDEANCIENFDDSIDFYVIVLNSFLKEADKIEDELNTFFEAKEIDEYRVSVHGLKSTSASVGFISLSENSRVLEFCCKNDDWNGVEKGHKALIEQLKASVALIRKRLNEYEEK